MTEKQIKNMMLNFGPQHPAAHGVLRLVLEMDGEVVERADPHIGLLHRGTEKLIEHKTYLQAMPYFDRLDYVSPMVQEHAFVMASEKLLNLEVPERALWIRVLFDEITRILNHALQIGAQGLDLGATTPFLWLLKRGRNLCLFMKLYQVPDYMFAYYRIGGVHQDVQDKVLDDIFQWSNSFGKIIEDIEELLDNNRIFKQRTVNIRSSVKKTSFGLGF